MEYCKKCVLPDTRPNLVLNEKGICNGCESFGTKKEIDWVKRERAFIEVVELAKSKSKGYDCLIPVSGGKDSTWQVVKCLEYGLNPLALTWKTPSRTSIGQKNLDNLISLGVDHIDYQVNPKVEKKFMLTALKKYGSTAIPMHMAIFSMPVQIAYRYDIPLIIWGENSAFEYGGEDEETKGFELNDAWLKKYGVTHGTLAKDWISDELSEKDLTPYFAPTALELKSKKMLAIFLGYYFNWDPTETYRVAKENGFISDQKGPRTGYYDFADIDDDFISIHHFIKWYKFGFTRLFDNLSLEIRNGRLKRREAIEIIRDNKDIVPLEDIENCSDYMGINVKKFFEIIEKFRNKKIWCKENGVWFIRNFIVEDFSWA